MSLSFAFDIYPASDKQKQFGIVANASVSIVINGNELVKLKGWNYRTGSNGVFITGPSQKTNKMKDGKAVYMNYVQLFPRSYNAEGQATNDRSEEYKAFQGQALQAYQTWEANGGNTQTSAPSAGSSLAPSTPTLPQGWKSGVDTGSGRKYFILPDGSIVFADSGDPRLAVLNSGAATPAPQAAANEDDIFAQFGSPGSF